MDNTTVPPYNEVALQTGPTNTLTGKRGIGNTSFKRQLGTNTDYEIRSHYESDKHRYQMGITSPGGFQGASVAFVQLASPTLLLVVDWTAGQVGAKPKIPPAESLDSNWILLDEIHYLGMVNVTPDGASSYYRESGTYVYGCRNPASNVLGSTPARSIVLL